MVLFINVFAMILMIASLVMSQISSTCDADKVLRYFWRLLPGFCLGNGLVTLSFLDLLPLIDATCDAEHGATISFSKLQPIDALDPNGVGLNLAFMAWETIVYLLIAILIDVAGSYPRIRLLFSRKIVPKGRPLDSAAEDSDVVAERQRVAAELASGRLEDVILLDGLRKVYPGGKVAVSNLSVGLPVGEVFGFLGVNGGGERQGRTKLWSFWFRNRVGDMDMCSTYITIKSLFISIHTACLSCR